MSLVVNEGSSTNIPLLPEDSYPAVCCMLADLGDQYSEKFGTTSRKVLISWELPGETLDDGSTRRMSNTYTASLNSKGNLRRDLIAWRGRDFTVDELKAFDLKNIVGAPCLLQVIHKIAQDGTKRAVIGGIMKLPKGMTMPTLSNGFTIFDLDDPDAKTKLAELPEWVQERVKQGETWKAMEDEANNAAAEKAAQSDDSAAPAGPTFSEQMDAADGEIPF
ncbi:MAG: hypothetical protein UH229_02975 [Lachnospiraceae bacterium]|nr:hypothetical protein [Lachnospiraceae bacterium]